MRNNINLYFFFSLSIHFVLLVTLASVFSRPTYITLPVEVSFYSPVSTKKTVSKQPPVKKIETKVVKKKEKAAEIVIPVKKIIDKPVKKIEKTIEKKEETKIDKKIVDEKKTENEERESAQKDLSLSESSRGGFRGGSNITLDVKNFPYAYYTNSIVKKISRSWTWSDTFGNLKTLIFFRIQKNGSLSEINVKKSSGDGYFDQQALRAVTLASPFPPLPAGYKENNLGVYFEFSYSE